MAILSASSHICQQSESMLYLTICDYLLMLQVYNFSETVLQTQYLIAVLNLMKAFWACHFDWPCSKCKIIGLLGLGVHGTMQTKKKREKKETFWSLLESDKTYLIAQKSGVRSSLKHTKRDDGPLLRNCPKCSMWFVSVTLVQGWAH